MKKLLLFFLFAALLVSLLSGCSADPSPASVPATTEARVQATTDAGVPVTTEPPAPSTTSVAPTETYSHFNEKGPFDDAHYDIGLRALQAIDSYLEGNITLSAVTKTLSSCYEEINALATLPDSDPLASGNDFVHSYVFLAYTDFSYQTSYFATKKYDDRNYLAAAIGEPEKDFSSVYSQANVEAFLDDAFASLQEAFPSSSFTYQWNEGDLFIDFNIPDFDYYYEHKAELTAEDRATLREITHGYVSGDVAKKIYDQIRIEGGSSFDVYFVLGGSELFCASRNLQIFMDPLNE